MSPVPIELLTFFASSFYGSVVRTWARNLDERRADRRFIQQAHMKSQIEARQYESTGLHWTRGLIALMAVLFVVVVPKLVAIFMPAIRINYGYTEVEAGFLFFTSAVEQVKWLSMQGLLISPLDTHITAAIIGLYFGGALASHH